MSLAYASGKGNLVLVRGLLERGTPVNGVALDTSRSFTDAEYVAHHFVTPLQQAAAGGHVEVVALLLKYGANLDANHEGDTPLNLAASAGHTDVVRILLAAGANQEIKWNGRKPIENARNNDHESTAAAFAERP